MDGSVVAPGTPALRRRPPRVFYGWWIVATSLLSMFMSAGFGYYALSAFFEPLRADLGWGRALVSGAVSAASLLSGLASPLVGRWTDRYGPRAVMLVGAVCTGLSFVAFSMVSAVWQLYGSFLLAAVGRAGSSGVPTSAVVANWFTRRRGLATGIATTGIGIGGVVTAPLAGYLVGAIGWRMSLLVFTALVWTILVPTVAVVVKTRPEDVGLLADGEAPPAPGGPIDSAGARSAGGAPTRDSRVWTLAQAWRTSSFWLLGLAYAFAAFPISASVLHAVPFFIGRGIPAGQAAGILGALAGVGVVGKLACGFLADRLSARLVLALANGLQIAGLVAVLSSTSPAAALVYVLVFGFGMGGVVALTPLVVVGIYGLPSFGTIFGATSLFYALGWAAGPFAAGLIYDATGSYEVAFVVYVVLYAVSAAAMLLVKSAESPRPGPARALPGI